MIVASFADGGKLTGNLGLMRVSRGEIGFQRFPAVIFWSKNVR